MDIHAFLLRLKNVRRSGDGWTALCPVPQHADKKNSLSVSADQGKILLKCHAGCATEEVVHALGLSMKDLFFESRISKVIAATYDYLDESGNLLYQVVRYEPKDFRQRRPDGKGGWIWNTKGIEPVPYRLPEVLAAIKEGKTVFIVEGEKDADNLVKAGLAATCNHGGAGKWTEHHSRYFPPGTKVVIIPDNDKPGLEHAEKIAGALAARKCEVKIVELPGIALKGDVSDWLFAGHTAEELMELVNAVPVWNESTGIGKRLPDLEDQGTSTGQERGSTVTLSADQIIEAARKNPADVFKQPILGSLAALPTPELARVKMAIKNALKGKVSMADLNQAVKEEKRRLRIHLRAAQPGERPEAPSLQEVLDGCPADIPVPPGWQISEEGIFEFVTRWGETGPSQAVEKRFPIPVVLTCVQKPLDPADEGTSYELAWLNGSGNWSRTAFPATTLFDKTKLTSTAAAGLPVDSENARGLLRWLAAIRDMKMLPSKQVVTRCGWHKDIFVLGGRVVNNYAKEMHKTGESVEVGRILDADDTGADSRVDWTSSIKSSDKELINGLHTKGDFERQKQLIVETVKKYPLAGFLIGASCAGPLMRLLHAEGRLEIHGFIVEVVSDQAGIGKTTGQELAASIWGNPGHLVRTFDRTTVAWEVLLYTLCDMPVFLEETQMASREDTALKLVYALALGMGRERGNRSGGMRATRQFWNTVLLASERSLKTFAAREGIEARVITLPPVFGGRSPERGEELRRLRAEYFSHYGHAGQAYVGYLVDQLAGGKWGRILDYYEKFYGLLDKALPLGIDGETKSIAMRMATRAAACWTGLQLLFESMGMERMAALNLSSAAVINTWGKITAELDTVPLWKKALAVIQSYAAENAHRIAGMEPVGIDGKERLPSSGYIGGLVNVDERKAVGFFPNAFDEMIKKYLGIEGETVRKGLVREGVIIPDKAGKSARNQRIRPVGGDSYTARVVCIPVEYVFPEEEHSKREGNEKEFSWDDI
jgi:5S rRNA maturation endonuclease (ribonuclease M5)